jgi:hypothetical protein
MLIDGKPSEGADTIRPQVIIELLPSSDTGVLSTTNVQPVPSSETTLSVQVAKLAAEDDDLEHSMTRVVSAHFSEHLRIHASSPRAKSRNDDMTSVARTESDPEAFEDV